MEAIVDQCINVLKALASHLRVKTFQMLQRKTICIREIQKPQNILQPTASSQKTAGVTTEPSPILGAIVRKQPQRLRH